MASYALFDGEPFNNKVSTPDHASLDITGDMDIRMLVAPDVWATGDTQDLIGKWGASDLVEAAYRFTVRSEEPGADPQLRFSWEDSVSTIDINIYSEEFVPGVDGSALWVRVAFDADNGAHPAVQFYTSADPIETEAASVVWTPLGGVIEDPDLNPPAVVNTTAFPLTIPTTSTGFAGKVYYAEIRNGINGTIVADPDFRDADQKTGNSPTTFTDTTGKVWTFDTAVWLPGGAGRRKIRGPRNPRRYSV